MPHETAACQLPRVQTSDSHEKSTLTSSFRPIPEHLQEVATTPSRRSGPRRWLRCVEWLIAQGFHPKANSTTLAVARDLAARMDYDLGHARYCMTETAARLNVHESTVKRHVAMLRELGTLAWFEHGTKANMRSRMGMGGYAGTATIYAATIPAVYDTAMGRTVIGTGYNARIVTDMRGTQTTPRDPSEPVNNSPVDNPGSGSCAPPSLTSANQEGQVKMVGGFTTTAARSPKISPAPSKTAKAPAGSSKKRATILGATVTAAGMRLGDKLARAIRHRAPWTRNATHDQLRWACADMGEQQWTEDQAVRFVVDTGHQHAAGFGWEPDRPHRLIAAGLRTAHESREQAQQMREDLSRAVAWQDSTACREQADLASLAALFAVAEPEPERTDEDRHTARLDWDDWRTVAAHYSADPDDALDLYGTRLCVYAVGQDARRNQPSYA